MDQRRKNIRLLLILIGMIIISTSLMFIPTQKRTTLKNVDRFQIEDTSAIDRITISSASLDNELTRTDTGWVINDNHKADENIMMVLLSVMKNVEIIRSISENRAKDFLDNINKDELTVNFYKDGEVVKSFMAGSNDTKTLSIFKSEDGNYFVVQLPGYESFVTGIFEIPAIDWRSRLLTSASPTTLKELSIKSYSDPDKSYTIKIEGNFPSIENIDQLDTLTLMDYMDQFRYFQADKFIESGEHPEYDSLRNHKDPWIQFSFRYHKSSRDIDIMFYPRIEGDKYLYATTSAGQNVLFDYKRIAEIFAQKQNFDKNIKKSR